jgi:hypothetical protein
MQFFLGSLFSAYTVFYFQSASLTKTAIFLVILIGFLVANEFIEDRLTSVPLLVTLFFFVSFSFTIFFLPVLMGILNRWMFFGGAVLSLLPTAGIMTLIYGKRFSREQQDQIRGAVSVGGLFVLLILFYVMNWIPPVPLSLKFGGIYHEVRREGSAYHLKFVEPSWYWFWSKTEDPFQFRPGDRVFCFTSIFAPTDLKTEIIHRWERYDEQEGQWTDVGRIGYPVAGGRAGGFRGYTYKQAVLPGKWRVNVEIPDGRLLSRIRFRIVKAEGDSLTLKTIRK